VAAANVVAWWWLLIAGLAWLAAGWFVRGYYFRRTTEAALRARLAAEKERANRILEHLKAVREHSAAVDGEVAHLTTRLQGANDLIDVLSSDLAARSRDLSDEQQRVSQLEELVESLHGRVPQRAAPEVAREQTEMTPRGEPQPMEGPYLDSSILQEIPGSAEVETAESRAADGPVPITAIVPVSAPKSLVPAVPSSFDVLAPPAIRPVPDQEVADDLSLIHGIGPKLAGLLEGAGFTTFRQIATATDADLDLMREVLGRHRGRIESHDWIAAAAALHREKHGEELE
jgi:predicted flap endonuclease-1-like 5' DNA nuclease